MYWLGLLSCRGGEELSPQCCACSMGLKSKLDKRINSVTVPSSAQRGVSYLSSMVGGWCSLFPQSSENWKFCFVSFFLFSTIHQASLIPVHFRSVDAELRSTCSAFCLVKSAFPSRETAFSMTCIMEGTFYQGLEYLLGSSLLCALWWADGSLLRWASVSNVPPVLSPCDAGPEPHLHMRTVSFNPNVAAETTGCVLFRKTNRYNIKENNDSKSHNQPYHLVSVAISIGRHSASGGLLIFTPSLKLEPCNAHCSGAWAALVEHLRLGLRLHWVISPFWRWGHPRSRCLTNPPLVRVLLACGRPFLPESLHSGERGLWTLPVFVKMLIPSGEPHLHDLTYTQVSPINPTSNTIT